MIIRISRAAALCALLATACPVVPDPANAETKLINVPADKFFIAPGGVDLRTGRYVYNQTDLTIGGENDRGLSLTRTMSNYVANHANPFGNFSHNWDIMLLETRVGIDSAKPVGADFRMNVHAGSRSYTFESHDYAVGYAYKSGGPLAWLTFSGDRASSSVVYTLRGPDGTIMAFRPMGSEDCADQAWEYPISGGRRRCAFISEMTAPDGTKFSFDYIATGSSPGNRVRLRRVTSSRGHALLLEGSGSRVTKACVLNLAHTTPPADGLCPANASATASYAYTSDGTRLSSATGADGAMSSFTYAPWGNGTEMGFVKAGQATPWLTNRFTMFPDEEFTPQEIIASQSFADGQSYTYGYQTTPATTNKPQPTIVGGGYTDADGHSVGLEYGFPLHPSSVPNYTCPGGGGVCEVPEPIDGQEDKRTFQQTPGPVLIVDALGRETVADYCDPTAPIGPDFCSVVPLVSFTDPEGIKTKLKHDGYGNVIEARRQAKPGSTASPDIVTSAAYDLSNAKSQTKPLWMKDANGNVTNFTYAPEHGGVLTETGPAVNGVRPQKRYSYEQRHAWIGNGAGGHVRAASPVWLLTSMSLCRTSAATGNPAAPCALAGDEVLTTYDYGPDGPGPNNLNLRGTVVTADGVSLRTCQSYDALGRRISETGAGANLAACQ